MTIRRLTTVAVLLAAVLTMGVGIAEAQTQTAYFARIAPKDSALDSSFVGQQDITVVVLQETGESYTTPRGAGTISEATLALYDVVVIDPKAFAIRTQIGLLQRATPLRAGTRLAHASLDERQACVDANNQIIACAYPDAVYSLRTAEMEIVSPGNSSPLLFTSNATMTGDSLGVITGQQDEEGFAEAVLTTKGQKPTFATLLTDEGLEPADRITGIIELDYDPETGITLYGGFLEY